MTHSSASLFGLTLLLIGCAAAVTEPDLQPQAMRSSTCQEHTSLHSSLDVVEKTVEGTVERLEMELAALLEAIDAPKWRPLLKKTGQGAVDILEDPVQRQT